MFFVGAVALAALGVFFWLRGDHHYHIADKKRAHWISLGCIALAGFSVAIGFYGYDNGLSLVVFLLLILMVGPFIKDATVHPHRFQE
jgi:hypothetical protein